MVWVSWYYCVCVRWFSTYVVRYFIVVCGCKGAVFSKITGFVPRRRNLTHSRISLPIRIKSICTNGVSHSRQSGRAWRISATPRLNWKSFPRIWKLHLERAERTEPCYIHLVHSCSWITIYDLRMWWLYSPAFCMFPKRDIIFMLPTAPYITKRTLTHIH